ncbi:MAG TPA: GNAT family N-acetyltransferase [Usitatibacter sp.]|jgi:ribosomal protein S18 acetylase RimI-like enzyme|nr:GNAT family N-acetyltransferase [Usitatibacter sp.]
MLQGYELHPDAFTSTVDERGSLPLSWWEKRLADGAGAEGLVLGAFEGARLAGVAGLSFEPRPKSRHKAHLFGMYVPSAFRGKGIGRALVLGVLEQARRREGVILVQLTVTDGNLDAQRLYEGCGFVVFGVEPRAMRQGEEYLAKVHMWCDLRLTG